MTVTPKRLRAVKPDEPKPKRDKSVAQAAASGSHRDLLIAMRDRIARTVSDPDCPPRDLASLTRRLQDIAKELDMLDARAKQEGVEIDGIDDNEAWDQASI